jgi:hypothetical protein
MEHVTRKLIVAGLTALAVGSATDALIPNTHDTGTGPQAGISRHVDDIPASETNHAKAATLADAVNRDELRSVEDRSADGAANDALESLLKSH